jgi:[acyl-carrier-protein] S-malonyltransferase
MKAYLFPGQGAQYVGMGKDLYEKSSLARDMFEKANQILRFRITDLLFSGQEDDLKMTKVTQPAIFLHSTILAAVLGDSFRPDMAAGHSLGEFSALTACGALSFDDGLVLVSKRAMAMQKACEIRPSTMAAVIGAEDNIVEEICAAINEIVVPANYNSPGQIVISGSEEGIDRAIEALREKGIRRIIKLAVGGAFHSPLMESAKIELEAAIRSTTVNVPICPVYQNVNARSSVNPEDIKTNLVLQLTSPVRWTHTVINMISDGADTFIEVGPGNVLQGLVKKINAEAITESAGL